MVTDSKVPSFARDPSKLKLGVVVPQALDPKWIPPDLLKTTLSRMSNMESRLGERDVRVRTEYIRSLINAEQIAVPRDQLCLNKAVARDYVHSGPQRKAFQTLLGSEVVVPYLREERTPTDFDGPVANAEAWNHLCAETDVPCVRLSWDDKENRERCGPQLLDRFGQYAITACNCDQTVLMKQLKLPPEDAPGFRNVLGQVARACTDLKKGGRSPTREDLYAQFVLTDDPQLSYFAPKIKLLLDLQHSVTLPDALGAFLQTPRHSLPRTALQEWRPDAGRQVTADELLWNLQNLAFALVNEPLDLPALGSLTLAEVLQVRRSQEWWDYQNALSLLLEHPHEFGDRAWAVYRSYIGVARQIQDTVSLRRVKPRVKKWTPVIQWVFNAAGQTLVYKLLPEGVIRVMAGVVAQKVTDAVAPVVVRLTIRGLHSLGSLSNLETSIDFLRADFDLSQRQWQDFIRQAGAKVKNYDPSGPQPPHVNYRK